VWNADAGWPAIARLIGGRLLGSLLAAAGVVSMWSLFNAQLLYISRLPLVMACDGWLPKVAANVTRDTAVPKFAILFFCAITAIFAALSFGALVVIICLLNTAALALEFLALIVLRVRRPNAVRSFRIPGGWLGISCVCVPFFSVATMVLVSTLREWRNFPGQLVVVGIIVFSGATLYFLRRKVAVPPQSPLQASDGDI
jgi:amino acid transporter